jgi:hypothetical protein
MQADGFHIEPQKHSKWEFDQRNGSIRLIYTGLLQD